MPGWRSSGCSWRGRRTCRVGPGSSSTRSVQERQHEVTSIQPISRQTRSASAGRRDRACGGPAELAGRRPPRGAAAELAAGVRPGRRAGKDAEALGWQGDQHLLALVDVRSRTALIEKSATSAGSPPLIARPRGRRAEELDRSDPRRERVGRGCRALRTTTSSGRIASVTRPAPGRTSRSQVRSIPGARAGIVRHRAGSWWCRRNRRRTRWPACDRSRGRSDLFDHAVVHHDDPVGHRERFLLIVGDHDRRNAEAQCRRRISLRRYVRTRASSAESGSSSRSSPGESASARATAMRCCWPPESCAGYLRPAPASRPGAAVLPRGCGFRLRQPAADEAVADVAATVRFGNSAYDWKTIPKSRPTPGAWRFPCYPERSARRSGCRARRSRAADRLAAARRTKEADELPRKNFSEMSLSAANAPNCLVSRSIRRYGAPPVWAFVSVMQECGPRPRRRQGEGRIALCSACETERYFGADLLS